MSNVFPAWYGEDSIYFIGPKTINDIIKNNPALYR